ncbi:MAG: OmpA family protein [Granulosicoccus sp.]
MSSANSQSFMAEFVPGTVARLLVCSAAMLLSTAALAQQDDEAEPEIVIVDSIDNLNGEQESSDFEPKFYVGIGAGVSDLDPDTSDVNVDLSDGSQTGYQVTIGADLNKWLSVELHGADLGSAELDNGGEIDYQEYGLSGLIYGGRNRGNYNRSGLTFFGRAGIGALSNDSSEGVGFEKQEDVHLILGAGAEYAIEQGFALRAEGTVFDKDASYLQLGLLYRFGSAPALAMPSISLPFGLGGSDSLKKAKPLPGDLDGDGVADAEDQCNETAGGQPIDEIGCPVFSGAIEGLNFLSGSDELTNQGKAIVDGLAITLLEFPDLRIRVAAHTDSLGDEEENMLLSRRRALAVSRHLIEAGISKFRLEAVSYGETQPIATNETREGRSMNRRVELTAIP